VLLAATRRYLGAMVLRLTRTSWCGRCSRLEARACMTTLPSMYVAVMRNGARMRVPAMGASAMSTSRPSVRKVKSGLDRRMPGDRLKSNRADRRRAGIAPARLHLLDTLERQVEVVAAAAVEDRQHAPAGGSENPPSPAGISSARADRAPGADAPW